MPAPQDKPLTAWLDYPRAAGANRGALRRRLARIRGTGEEDFRMPGKPSISSPSGTAAGAPVRAGRGLADVVAASTALSDIDGRAGRLFYRGYDIHDLGGRISFEECVHLLQRGALPDRHQLEQLRAELVAGRGLGATAEALLVEMGAKAAPMEALRTLVSALSVDDPDKDANDPTANARKAVRLVAQLPVLVARYHAVRSGTPAPDPDPGLGIAGNFLLQITGRSPDPVAVEAFDECLVLHADHTMNASTFACRVCAATLSDMHSAVVAGIGTLKGSLHGGANEAVMSILESLGGPDAVESSVRGRLDRGEKLMGFGHRVYRTEDPRATHLRRLSQRLGELAGDTTYYEMSMAMEKVVLDAKGLYPNVDYFAASVYHALGIPTDLFTPVFAISRMAGWTSHVIEQQLDNRLIRPDSEYIGETDQKWVPIEER
ncbi:MAG: citrate synthase [Actinomycetota bacterium]|nr:citrate synthase [Actinomycetota bacterium]